MKGTVIYVHNWTQFDAKSSVPERNKSGEAEAYAVADEGA